MFIYLFILNQFLAIHPSFDHNSVTTSYTFYEINWDFMNLISYFNEQMLFCGAFPSELFSPCFFITLATDLKDICPMGFYSVLEAVSSFTAFL